MTRGVRLASVRAPGRLDGISLRIESGERVALLGRNGVGKSSLLRVIAGLLSIESGRAEVEGPVGYVAQEFHASLLPWYRVADNIALPLVTSAKHPRERLARVRRALEIVPLRAELLSRFPYELSGGEQQLVAIARAIVASPRVLLLDEPFSALDLATRVAVREALCAECERAQITTVLVSHDLDDAVAFAPRAVVLSGRPPITVYDGTLEASVQTRIESFVIRGTEAA